MSNPTVTRETCARIPTAYGDFQLCYYTNTQDAKEHLAFYMGKVSKKARRMDHLLQLKPDSYAVNLRESYDCQPAD